MRPEHGAGHIAYLGVRVFPIAIDAVLSRRVQARGGETQRRRTLERADAMKGR